VQEVSFIRCAPDANGCAQQGMTFVMVVPALRIVTRAPVQE